MIQSNIKSITIIGFVALAVSSIILFHIKYKVQELKQDFQVLNKEKVSLQQSIHVLNAELANLTNPKALKILTKRYLDLSPIQGKQVKSIKLQTGK